MKAYALTADYVNDGLIVFAVTPGKAKSLAGFSAGLCDVEWTDLICKRQRDADKFYKEGQSILSFSTEEGQRLYRELGWASDESWSCCVHCGLGQWDKIPESQLNEEDECKECV